MIADGSAIARESGVYWKMGGDSERETIGRPEVQR
jgi:hypothetical protein